MINRIRKQVARAFQCYVSVARGFTTFTKSSNPVALALSPELIVIDKASQDPEPVAAYPLVQHVDSWKRVLLVINHKRLPPCILTTLQLNPFREQSALYPAAPAAISELR
jgi:superfamily I DNA and/or RNA helicase